MKVNSKKSFAKIDYDVVPKDIEDTDLLPDYTAEEISFAQKLKGQHEKNNTTGTPYYTDKYYLDYARKYLINLKHAKDNAKLALALFDMNNSVPDPEWSMYSYEEIIAMADNGVNVPKNVLGWAKAQQESDVTAYVIVADNAENDDNSSTSEVAGENDINKLRAQAQSYVTRANKEQEKAVEEAEKIDHSVKEAKVQKTKYENRAKDSVQNSKNIGAELKSLEQKKNAGSLTQTEASRYNQLTQQMDSQSVESLELQKEGALLDDFLDSIDTFNETQESALKLSQEAKDAGINFGQLEKTYSDKDVSHSVNNFQTSSIGTLNDLMAGISDGAISDITIIKAKDFEKVGEDAQKTVKANSNSDAVSFAQVQAKGSEQKEGENTPTTEATKTLTKSRPLDTVAERPNDAYAIHDKQQKQAAKNDNNEDIKDLENVKTEAGYGPDLSSEIKTGGIGATALGGAGALAAGALVNFTTMAAVLIPTNIANTALTLTSMATLAINKSNVKKTKGFMNKNVKTLNAEMKNLEKTSSDMEKAHEANIALGEMLFAQAKELEQRTQDYVIEFVTKAEEKSQKTEENSDETQNSQQGGQEELQDPFAGERTALAGKMDKLAQKDAAVFDKSKTPLKRANKAELNAAKSVSALGNQNEKLEEANKVNKQQSILSIATGGISLVVGAMGLIKGFKQIATGKGEIATGTPMLSSAYPATVAAGALLVAKGTMDVSKGMYGVAVSTGTLISGAAAGVAGAGGLILTNQIKGDVKGNSKEVKSTGKEISQQRKLYLRIKKAMAKSKQAKVPQIDAQSATIAQAQGALASSSSSNSSQSTAQNNNQQAQVAQNNSQAQVQTQAQVSGVPQSKQKTVNNADTLISPAAKKDSKTTENKTAQPSQNNAKKTDSKTDKKETQNNIQTAKPAKNNQKAGSSSVAASVSTSPAKGTQTKETSSKQAPKQAQTSKTQNNKAAETPLNSKVSGKKQNKDTSKASLKQASDVKNSPKKSSKTENKEKTNKTNKKDEKKNINNEKQQELKIKQTKEKENQQKIKEKQTPKKTEQKDKKLLKPENKTDNKKEKAQSVKVKHSEQKGAQIITPEQKKADVQTPEKQAEAKQKTPKVSEDKKSVQAKEKQEKELKLKSPVKPKENEQKQKETELQKENLVEKTDKKVSSKKSEKTEKEEELKTNKENNPIKNQKEQPKPFEKTTISARFNNVAPNVKPEEKPNELKQEPVVKPDEKLQNKLPQDKLLEKTEKQSDAEKVLLKDKNQKAKNNLNQSENKDEDKQSVNPSKVKNLEVKPKEQPKKPELKESPQKAPEPEIVPIKDNDGRTVNLKTDKIQPHSNKKVEETKLKDDENLRKTQEDKNKKELSKNINETNTEVLKEAIIAQIEAVVNKNDVFEGKNPTETNTVISGQIDAINSLKQRFASIDDRSENISASATVNANTKDRVHTDDKADKKLTRFNNDSIIESKKKRKKVVAVSEAFGGSTKR